MIKVEDRRVADPPPFEQVQGQLQQQLAMELRTEYVEQLRQNAEIERLYQPPQPEQAPAGAAPEETSPPAAPPQ